MGSRYGVGENGEGVGQMPHTLDECLTYPAAGYGWTPWEPVLVAMGR